MKVFVSPNKIAFDNFLKSNGLTRRDVIWVNNKDSVYKTYGLELKEKDIVFGYESEFIEGAKRNILSRIKR